ACQHRCILPVAPGESSSDPEFLSVHPLAKMSGAIRHCLSSPQKIRPHAPMSPKLSVRRAIEPLLWREEAVCFSCPGTCPSWKALATGTAAVNPPAQIGLRSRQDLRWESGR